MMFHVVTVAREYGSGGAAIARRVADRLGWELLDKNLIDAIARAAQVDVETARRYDECVDSWWRRIHRGGLWSAAIVAGATPAEARFVDAETMACVAREVIAGAAKGNCVIVGRGAQCVLQECPEALHVFVYAPWAERVARITRRAGPASGAEDRIRSTDQIRAAYIRRYFWCDWKDPHLYHMMLSSELGEDNAVRLIMDAVEKGEPSASLKLPSLGV